MRKLLSFLLPAALLAQAPVVGIIDVYGARKTTAAEVKSFLGLKTGVPLPASKGDLEEALEVMPGVVAAHIEAACCEDKKAILYVGIEERGAPHFDYHVPPTEKLELPAAIASEYKRFLDAVRDAGKAGQPVEDLSKGHSLLSDPVAREIQQSFTPLADHNLDILRKVIRTAADEEQRAIAAYVIGYTTRKAEIIPDLQYALQDSDDTVRNNAIRSLAALAVLSRKDKTSGIRVSSTWLVEMLNSVVWSDRNNAAVALVNLTETRDPNMLSQIRDRALFSLTEMAGWQYLPHALPAYIVLGRVKGYPEKELQDLWSSGHRGTVIEAKLKPAKSSSIR